VPAGRGEGNADDEVELLPAGLSEQANANKPSENAIRSLVVSFMSFDIYTFDLPVERNDSSFSAVATIVRLNGMEAKKAKRARRTKEFSLPLFALFAFFASIFAKHL
jgi:hypothetical protein